MNVSFRRSKKGANLRVTKRALDRDIELRLPGEDTYEPGHEQCVCNHTIVLYLLMSRQD